MRLDPPVCDDLRHDQLLLHYVDGAQHTVQSVDQLGNFLMGFGVLALGFMLQADLHTAAAALDGGAARIVTVTALLTLAAWGAATGLLVAFVWTYIARVIVGRSVHAADGDPEAVGAVLTPPEGLGFEQFLRGQRSFGEFLKSNYRTSDRRDPEALLYARWTYMRFMTLKKLAAMERMRGLLGLALVAGVAFKVLHVYLGALVG